MTVVLKLIKVLLYNLIASYNMKVSSRSCFTSKAVFDPVLSFNMRVYRGVVSTE